jgi:hypothetical protein
VIQTALACPFDVVGAVAHTTIGTVTAYTDRVAATNTAAHLVASDVSDWSSHVGKRVDVLDGAQAGAVAWVAKSNPHSLGAGVARVTRFSKPGTSTFAPAAVSPASGSALALATLPEFVQVSIETTGPVQPSSTDFVANRSGRVSNIKVETLAIRGQGRYLVDGCDIGYALGAADAGYASPTSQTIARSLWRGNGTSTNVDWLYVRYCLFGYAGSSLATVGLSGSPALAECLIQGANVNIFPRSSMSGCGVFDSSSRAISSSVYYPGAVYVASCFGRDNLAGIALGNNTNFSASPANTITGSAGDIYLSGQTAYIPHTALPWVDGARSGEATLAVPGTGHDAESTSYVDVTVPYVLASQKIIASHKTFGGIMGLVLAKYIDATTIRVVSTSSTDTSVVTWHILPVGDNAVIRS